MRLRAFRDQILYLFEQHQDYCGGSTKSESQIQAIEFFLDVKCRGRRKFGTEDNEFIHIIIFDFVGGGQRSSVVG